jgi:hypothetical protein
MRCLWLQQGLPSLNMPVHVERPLGGRKYLVRPPTAFGADLHGGFRQLAEPDETIEGLSVNLQDLADLRRIKERFRHFGFAMFHGSSKTKKARKWGLVGD